MLKPTLLTVAAAAALALSATPASAGLGPVSVAASASIYDAGSATNTYGSVSPTLVTLFGGTNTLTFTNVTGSITCGASTAGCISLDTGGHYNDADGAGAGNPNSSSTGTTAISGITLPNAGALVGVFLGANGLTLSAPTALNFTTGTGIAFASLSPQLNQTFFIGDGLTGDGTGTTQTFSVPTGATALYLGISDACGYNGAPGCYNDNLGSYSVQVNQSARAAAVPEPAGWALLSTGLLALVATRRKRGANAPRL